MSVRAQGPAPGNTIRRVSTQYALDKCSLNSWNMTVQSIEGAHSKGSMSTVGEEYGDVRPCPPLKNKSMCSKQVALSSCFTKPHLPHTTWQKTQNGSHGRCQVRWQGSSLHLIIHVMNCFMAGTGMHWEGPRSSGMLGLPWIYSHEPTVKFSELLQTSC